MVSIIRRSKQRHFLGDPSKKYVFYLFSEVHKWQAVSHS